MKLQSFTCGEWVTGVDDRRELYHAVTGEPVAQLGSGGFDYSAMLCHARDVGGPALRALTFHQRALRLKSLAQYLMERKEIYYELSAATGATRTDSWIDIEGGIGTLFTYSGKGRRELPNARWWVDGAPESLSRKGTFAGQHVLVPREGAAIHINAFNFPCWGMLEKLAPTLLAGMPAIVKPASQTAWLAERMFRDMIESKVLPAGSLQLICGGVGDLLDHVEAQDVVTFTGSANTGARLRAHPRLIETNARFNMEADSLNCCVLGPEAAPGSAQYGLFVDEVVREMTSKTGQKCTAIRRAIVPAGRVDAVVSSLREALAGIVTGDPQSPEVTMGPLVSQAQRDEVRGRIAQLRQTGEIVFDGANAPIMAADAALGAFMHPTLLYCADALRSSDAHEVEAFGPVATVMPYDTTGDAIALAAAGGGSLVGSVCSADTGFVRDVVYALAPWHGRLLLLERQCAAESTGHGSPLPALVHGGPGRAGGGEELGGVRSLSHYLQRTALQGSPDMLAAVTERWIAGAQRNTGDIHPFRKKFDELQIGDALLTAGKAVTLEDIEHFADFTGDRFYAHMDESAARANPFFDGRVAHGYYIVALAAGLFVDPDPGPVLANYGLDNLRFMQPVYPGDELRVAFTCKHKTARENEPYGEVRWDTTVLNQDDRVVAQYDVLTLVAS